MSDEMADHLTLCIDGLPEKQFAAPPIGQTSEIRIGRDPACDVVIQVDWVSRQHCRIGYANGQFWIEDLKSREGTTANGQPAVAAYCRGAGGAYELHTLQVFTVTSGGISHNVVFQDAQVFAAFHLTAALS